MTEGHYGAGSTCILSSFVRDGRIAYREYLRPELAEAYLAAEREAQTARRGLLDGRFIEPSKWRRRERLSS